MRHLTPLTTARRGLALALAAALTLPAATAHADPPDARATGTRAEAADYIDPSYDPNAHGGLPYVPYLKMTRGTARRSTGMMATGIVFVGLGVTFMIVGSVVDLKSGSCSGGDVITPGGNGERVCFSSTGAGHTSGVTMLVAGLIGTALGVPLWILGGSQVPYLEASGASERGKPGWARLLPAISPLRDGRAPSGAATAQGVDLTWRF